MSIQEALVFTKAQQGALRPGIEVVVGFSEGSEQCLSILENDHALHRQGESQADGKTWEELGEKKLQGLMAGCWRGKQGPGNRRPCMSWSNLALILRAMRASKGV